MLRVLHAGRRLLGLALLGTLAFVSGCSDDKAAPKAGPEDTAAQKAKEDSERAARENAYGKGGMTTDKAKKD